MNSAILLYIVVREILFQNTSHAKSGSRAHAKIFENGILNFTFIFDEKMIRNDQHLRLTHAYTGHENF